MRVSSHSISMSAKHLSWSLEGIWWIIRIKLSIEKIISLLLIIWRFLYWEWNKKVHPPLAGKYVLHSLFSKSFAINCKRLLVIISHRVSMNLHRHEANSQTDIIRTLPLFLRSHTILLMQIAQKFLMIQN